ncbi:DUF4304 domain-containing protein [Hymenobacter baengnokdamensis]|uniref:DUF4304 domain-containing protein n=1 Tax=Hymenobacter baengnokdamensis TaxID=2615203 RepID=UPI00124511C0|nr:DUF4304 domain-containing protein [Hymenobacter baengnokdamensis]
MADLHATFNDLIRTVLWPGFKAMGYKKSGNNFRYYNSEGWGKIVQFQKSQYNSVAELSFTVNVGLYLPEVEYWLCSRDTGPKFQEPACVVRKRIGRLADKQSDNWFRLTPGLNTTELFAQLVDDFNQYVHPYLAAINSKVDIYSVLVAGYQSDCPPAQIHAMFCAGYQDSALKLFRSELARSKHNNGYRNTLRALAKELELPAELWTVEIQ